ncbi:MAG: ABC transporter ATP-binding protein [Pirellulaceae bacterium]
MLDRLRLAFYFFRYLKFVRWLVVLVIICTVISALIRLPMTFLPMVLTEQFETNRPFVFWYIGFVLVTMILGWVVSVLMSYWGAKMGETLVQVMRNEVFRRLERLSMLAVFSKGPGEFVQELGRDVKSAKSLIVDTLRGTGMQVAQGVTVLVSMLILEPVLTLIILAALGSMSLVIRLINRRVEHYAGRGRDIEQKITGNLVENVGGFRDIVASGKFSGFADVFNQLLEKSVRINVTTSIWGQLTGLIPAMVVSTATICVYYFWIRQIESVAQVGEVITYAALLGQLFPAVLSMAQWTSNLAITMPSLRALHGILNMPALKQPESPRQIERPIESITFNNVCFDLENRRIINDVSFEIPGGKLTAIVGESGSGKTTLFHLLLRLLEPTTGSIEINNVSLNEYSVESLRENLGFIPQRPFIFNQSLRDNLLMAAGEEVAADRINDAIEVSQLSEVIEQRREQGGIDAVAGYMGNRLSGGEQQRIALGRLILQDPQIIVCDEYTANIDVKTARVIHDTMRDRFKGLTRIVITHELYTIKGADHIVVLDLGRVVESGTHEQLMRNDGLYRALCEVQTLDAD